MGVRRLDEYLRQLGRSAREGSIDVEALIRRLVEEVVASIQCSCPQSPVVQAAGSLEERLSELSARIARLEDKLSRLESAIEKLESSRGGLTERDVKLLAEAIAEALSKAGVAARVQGQKQQEPRWLREVASRIRERGYVLLSELPPSLREEVNLALLGEKGYVVEKLAGDVIVASVDGIRRFADMLSRIKSSDEFEAELKLAEYGRLFRLLRSEGLVYYNASRKGWVIKAFKSILSS